MKPDPDIASMTLHETASAWFTRRHASEDWSDQVEAELQAWLRADPRHRQAYQEMAEIWDAFDHVARPVLARDERRSAQPALTLSSGRDRTAAGKAGRHSTHGWHRLFGSFGGSVIAVFSLCMVVGIGAWYWHGNKPQFSAHFHTARGEQREVSLPDGTVVTLNMDSHLDVRFYPRRREVVLIQGEAFFEVASDRGAAFLVKADNTHVRVVGTAFNVRTGSQTHSVKVREGVVEVSRRGDNGYTEVLRAGEALEVGAATGVRQRLLSTPEAAGSWRIGQLMFRNATLAEVADELRGYLGGPIELVGRGIRDQRLSGFASTKAPEDFLNALPQLLPVDVLQLPDGGYRILAR
jgi:transmembrane sensor